MEDALENAPSLLPFNENMYKTEFRQPDRQVQGQQLEDNYTREQTAHWCAAKVFTFNDKWRS